MFRFLLLGVLSCISFCVHLPAQLLDEVPDVASNFRSARSGRWVDLSTWQVLRSGVWITATREVGVPNGFANVFIEAGHTVIATRATTEAAFYNGAQGSAFLDVINLNIHTNASITTTWGSVVGGFAPTDWYDGDRFGGFVSTEYAGIAAAFPISTRFGNQDTAIYRVHPLTEPQIEYRPRNMELRIYGNLRYYSGSAFDRSDRAAQIQVTAATIGTGSTLVFRGVSRVITQAHEWSTTLATQTGYFDNTAYTASMLASNPPERHANFRGLMGRNSFWTAIFDLGRINNRNYSADQFEGPTDDPSTAVGTLQGTFTAGIVQVRRGTLRVEAPALLVNEGSVTSGVLHVMNNAVLQMVSGNVGRTGVYAEQFADGSANYLTSTECRVTSRMRYAVVEEGGALEFPGTVSSLSAADVRFNGTVIYSRTGDQTLVQDSPYLSFNPAGPIIAPGLAAGENGLFDPYNNNFNANAGVQQAGDPTSGVLSQFGSSPSGLGVGTAALFQPSTTAAYSHLVLLGSGTKFLPVTTVTISRALILQGEARLGLQNLAYPGVPVSAGNASAAPVLPYYLSQAHGGELRASQSASKAGYFPPLVYLRSTGLTGFREENNIGTTLRTSLSGDGTESTPFAATPQPLWSAYGGNTDPVAFVGFTTASTRLIIYDQALCPEGSSFPVGITLSASTNREQMDMTPSIKAPVVHGLPAEPSYLPANSANARHGYAARGVFYGDAPQALGGARFGQVIRQTLNRVNGTQSATTLMQKPLTGVQNFVNGFPVITNSLYDAPINSTATTTLQYDSEWDAMSQIEFPRGVWGAHNVVINSPSNVSQTLPQRTADFQPASGNGVNWGLPHLNFANHTSALTGATAGTLIAGPEHVMTANGHLPRHAFDPRTGLYQPNAVYNETTSGTGNSTESITPGTLASAYIDTRPDVANSTTKINDQYYTTGVGLRPSVSLTGTFDGRTRAGFPQGVANAPSVFGTTQTITTTAPNDFGRRGDFNNFGVLELRRGNLNGVNGRLNIEMQTLTLSSTAIISPDQAKVTYRGERVGTNNARARVCLSDATGSESYPRQTIWNSVGVRYVGDGVGGIVVRGPAGYVWGTLTLGTRASLIITGGTGGTIAVASQSPLLRFRAQGIINTGFDELPAALGIPGLEALPALPDAAQITVNSAPDPNGFNNAWNLDLPYIRRGVGNLTMLRGTSNILTLVGNDENSGDVSTASAPELAGLQVFGTIATARGSLDLNGRNIELSGTTSTLVEAFERSPRPSSVVNRHTKARAYIGLTSPRAVPLLDSAAAAQSLASGGVPLAASLAGLSATIVNANFNADSTRFRVRRWQTSAANALTRLNAPNVPLANRYWTIETSGTQRITRNFGLVLNYTDADVPQSLTPAPLALLRGQLLPTQTPFQALAPSDRTDTTRKRTKQLALFAPEQVVYGQSIIGTGNFALQQDSTQAGFQLWALGVPAPVSLVLRGQRFGGRFGDPIGAGFEGAATDIVGFPPPFGAAWQGGGISRQAANDFGAIIGPFKAGVPTCATIIGEVLDELGNVAQFAPSTGAALVVGQVGGGLGPWNTGVPALFSRTTGYPSGKIGAVSRGGRFEWANVRLDGVASTTVTMTLVNDLVDIDGSVPRPNSALRLGYADPQPVQVSLQGGFPFSETFATQHVNNSPNVPGMIYPGAQGPFAVPGAVASDPVNGFIGYAGSTSYIEVGKTVVLPYSSPGYSAITGIIKDRFGNYVSFPTVATISIAGGSPPVDQQRTPLVGQISKSGIVWGLGNLGNESGLASVISSIPSGIQSASRVSPALAPTGAGYAPFNNPQVQQHIVFFPNFQIWGATASNVTLVLSITNFDPFAPFGLIGTKKNTTVVTWSPAHTSATFTLVPGPAVGIAPVIVPDVYNRNQLDRMPSRMTIGVSNKNDPRTWFYVQAVDQFGNRVDNGPNAYNGGTAEVRFISPEEGLPKNRAGTFQFSIPDTTNSRFSYISQVNKRDIPYIKRNNQRYSARGTSAPAINGLYTFNDFTPLGPASLEALGKDVVLTFEDERLQGTSGTIGLYPPIPPITTATTTFVPSAVSLVLRGQRFGGKFGDPIGAGFEGATTDILGFPPPFGAAWQGGGISRQAANDFGAIIGPFKAGFATCATIIGEVLDELGNVAQFAPSTGAALVVGQVGGGLGPWNTGVPSLFSGTNGRPDGKIGAVSRGGRFEWANVRLDGVASTTVTMTLVNDLVDKDDGVPRPNPASQLVYADPQPVQVSLQGGFPFFATFATQHINNSPDVPGMIYPGAQGPFAVPGTVASDPWNGITGYAGSTPYIEVGKTVVLPYSSPGYSSITGIVIDRFGNYASFPTTATISIAGGSPPVDQQRTPLLGQVSEPQLVWGLGNLGNESGLSRVIGSVLPSIQSASRVSPALAPTGAGYAPYNNPQLRTNLVSFPNFQIWGATSSNVTMVMSVYSPWWWVAATNKNASEITSSSGNTSSTITIAPGPAVGIAPVIVPDVYNRNQPDRMPSKMFIGASNRGNPSTWFYVQAVDQFGNRVDNGPNAYSGGTANIRFFSPEEGLPKNTSGTFQFTTTTPRDPYVRANNQRYVARGTSAPAINGLYTFNDFTSLGPASLEALGKDVVLTFEDERLQGIRAPLASGIGLYRPIPPITTATTTFVPSAASLVLRGQRFGGRFGDPIGAGFEGAGVDIVGFPPPFGSFVTGGGISRTTADQYGAIIGPFKAGVPTSATIIGEVLDDMGAVAQFAPSTGAALVVGQVGGGAGPWNTGVPSLFSGTTGYPDGKIGAVSRGGRFEWANVRLDGIASTTVTLTLTNDIVDSLTNRISPNPAPRLGYGDPQPVQVSLQGGFPFSVTFATQNMNNTEATKLYPGAQGPFAAPGRVEGYDGSIPTNAVGVPTNGIVVGQQVAFPYATPGFSAITVIQKDRYGNYASFPTTATISISGGSPPVDQQRTPLVGQVATSTVVWGLGNLGLEVAGAPPLAQPGIARVYGVSGEVGTQMPQTPQQVNPQFLPTGVAARDSRASLVSPALAPTGSGYAPYNNPQVESHLASFPNFQIWGATASNVTLTVSSTNFDPNAPIGLGALGSTSATVHIVPAAAVGIAPVLIPDPYNRNQLDRMPSRMTIGVSNKNDPRTWFYVQAHDQFQNRVDNGPNAYIGGTASITFRAPQQGLPGNAAGTFQFSPSSDANVKVNAQKYEAKGLSATAINGLYTFNDFTPLGPASLDPLGKDVVLTFEDNALPGVRAPLAGIPRGRLITFPPITTATTTFVQPPTLTLSASDSVLNGARKAAPNALFLRERARTYRSTQNALETGFVRLTRPVTALADPTLNVQYSLDYFNATGGFDTTTFRISDRARLTSLPLAGTTTLPLPSAIILPDGLPSPALFPPMPQPVSTTINGLQGDVAPLAVGASGLSTAALGTSGTIAFESGAVSQNVRFSARFSDQTYPRNPARQGVRLAVMRLLADTTLPYRVERGADSAFVVLADPASADPLCINPLADKLYLMTGTNNNPIQETLELEPPAWTSLAGKPAPAWVFYDDNYDALQYAVSSSDTTLVRVSVNAVDMRFSGRPTLNYTIPAFAPVETSASVILTASDGFSQARDTFVIALRRPVGVELAQMPEPQFLRLSPNPTTDEAAIDFSTPRAGVVRFCLRNVLGVVVWQLERSVYAGEHLSERVPMQHCAAGVYLLEAQLGAERSVVKVVKE